MLIKFRVFSTSVYVSPKMEDNKNTNTHVLESKNLTETALTAISQLKYLARDLI